MSKLLSTDEETPYYAAFGRFIIAYANVETMVHQVARKLSGLSDEKARVIFGGMRMSDVTIRIRALLKISKRSDRSRNDIESCLAQFDIIGTERDKMVHRYTILEKDSLRISNMMTSKSILSYEQDNFTIPTLQALRRDCMAISLRLAPLVVSNPVRTVLDRQIQKDVRAPWQYKPVPLQTQTKRKNAEMIATLLNRPLSSRPK
jgi:hypothetical protein